MKPIDKFEIEPGVMVKIYPEEDPDWSWVDGHDDTDEMHKKIRRGDVEQYVVEVSVFDKSGHVEGLSSIGGVVVGFDDHKQEIRDTIDCYEMIEEAREDLVKKLKEILVWGAK